MKKATILILVIIYVGSVFIVGIYGMKSIPFEEILYCEEIIPTSVVCSDGSAVELKQDKDGYYVNVKYTEGMYLIVNYNLNPSDCTYKDVSISIQSEKEDPGAYVDEQGVIYITRKVSQIIVVYKAQDEHKAELKIKIYTR